MEKDFNYLSYFQVNSTNRLFIRNFCINSISVIFDQLKLFAQGKVDIRNVAETKLGSTVPTSLTKTETKWSSYLLTRKHAKQTSSKA